MNDNYIYSIGYGLRKIEDFISLLNHYNLKFVLDIRSVPYSKWNPAFNQSILENRLTANQIRYVYLGKQLGAKPEDLSCYENGKLSYNLLKQKPYFIKGLERIITANNKQVPIAIMCNKHQPHQCHRSRLVGEELLKYNIVMQHIIEQNLLKNQYDITNEATKGLGTVDLFGNTIS